MQDEKKLTFLEVDKLASTYGWTIEYISKLDRAEVTSLLEAIKERELEHYRTLSYIVALGMAGKTLDDLDKQPVNNAEVSKETTERHQQEQKTKMIKLFQLLGTKADKIQEGLKQGKLKA
jgi:hypothetical protein